MPRSSNRKELDRIEIARRYLRGETQEAIASDYGVSRQQISKDIAAVRQAWKAEQVALMDEHIAQKIEEVRRVKAQAWEAWERSRQDKEIVTESTTTTEDGFTEKRSVRREGQAGNPAFLREVMECIKQECILLGLPTELKYQDINAAIATVIANGFTVTDGTMPDE